MTIEEFLTFIGQRFGEVEIAISAVTLSELVHGVARANTPEVRAARRAFIDELKKHVPVHPITDSTAEIAGQLSGEQAAKGVTLPDLVRGKIGLFTIDTLVNMVAAAGLKVDVDIRAGRPRAKSKQVA
jgi:predicted nucleic acid-binding protein